MESRPLALVIVGTTNSSSSEELEVEEDNPVLAPGASGQQQIMRSPIPLQISEPNAADESTSGSSSSSSYPNTNNNNNNNNSNNNSDSTTGNSSRSGSQIKILF